MSKKKEPTFPIKPLSKYLFVKRVEAFSKSKGGILIADSAKEKPQYGVVLEIGPDVDSVVKGNLVLFGKYAGAEVEVVYGDVPVLMLEKDEIIGVVVDKELAEELMDERTSNTA